MKINPEILIHYFGQKGSVVLLESQSNTHAWSQKSFLAAFPKAEIKARNNQLTIIEDGEEHLKTGNPWQALQDFRKKHANWLFGYLGYDLKNHLETLSSENPDPVKAPDLYFMVPQFLLEYDKKTLESKVLLGQLPDNKELSGVHSGFSKEFYVGNSRSQISKKDYLLNIGQVQHRIAEGDFYEINLSHQIRGSFSGSALGLYQQMKQTGPVPFGAFLKVDDLRICSQSPERFLRKEGSTVISQPIKGTSHRSADLKTDQALKQQLSLSSKEQAENLMIVDLVRNDLSRIARRGSVNVPKLFNIESFETVHQMVSTVTAETDETDPVTILKACFPMGSMTGAPKISAMKSIEEVENYRRGVYSGAIGYMRPDGDFDFNVVIRTALIKNGELFYSVGGAITSDSDPEAEWEETQIKAKALFDALQANKQPV